METSSSEQSEIYDVFNGPGITNVSLGSHPLDEPRTELSRLPPVYSDQNKIKALNVRFMTHIQIGSFDEALVILHRILDMEPNELVSLFNRGMLNLLLDKNEEALLDLNRK
ncbi:tetratricopeptide repeat protein [Gigaspora margarita]|uniref:Tetratricopeptide repeat protein n=1 Tax=Gigaspora margarita TaxID=4874 RepID=A0A8H4EV13_GIGMA|nr:tetratricopeptide repeat protein [Gigaspora margarita]